MRWPFRRRNTAAPAAEGASGGTPAATAPAGGAAPAGSGGVASGTGVAAGGASASARAAGAAGASGVSGGAGLVSGASLSGGRHWAALPVIPVTINRGAPLLVGPPPVLPPMRPAARSAATPEVAPAVGAVTGIVQPVPVPVAEPVAEAAPPPPLPPAPVVRRPVRTTPVEAPVLTDAVDEYLGEPREALEPYRAPSWLRYASNPGLPMLPGLPEPEQPLVEPPSFLPPELRSAPQPPPEPVRATEPPPRMVEGVERAEAPEQRPMRKRRPNLGQTRRLGLGAPIPAPEKEALVHPEAPPRVMDQVAEPAMPQEPPPPPAAPVRVAPEPAPAPAPKSVRPNPVDGPAPEKRTSATTYRATADLLPPRPPRPRPRATVVDAVPADLANAIRARQHADVSDVSVYRGPAVDEAAKARGAKAFASGGAVFLPSEAGPVDSPKARGVLAHELVHAVQQRTLGPVLPAADSPLGQRLEAEAQTAERFYGGESGAEEPAPLIHAPQPAAPRQPEPDLTAPAQLLTTPAQAPPPPTPAPQPVQSPFDQATKAEVGRIAEESARHVVTEWTNPKLERKQNSTSGSATTPQRPAFDRSARKDALVRQTLEVINQERFEQGKEPLTDLDAMHYERIERQLDDEQSGTTSTTSTTPPRPSYRPNSKEAWIAGLTGQDPSEGLGLGGLLAKPGSEKSWFQGGAKDDRPLAQRLMTGLGLANEDSATQFNPDSWFSDEQEQKPGTGTQDAAARQQAGQTPGSAQAGTDDAEQIPVSRLDLDELCERLYDRLRSRLRLELLVDRERAGLLTDFR